MQNRLKDELYNILSGTSKVRFGAIIQAITSYLDDGAEASSGSKGHEHHGRQEKAALEKYITNSNLWINDLDFSQYVSEGA
ncbi:hypothetical protein [Flavobacterium caeni]|uniref:hypothetical protein n=1 Tax=Flavobacterium caeni TaxID=490189 RepID=UPI001FCDDA1F|nr:hypothetical protein [Flavobacterium caeni]